MKTSNRVNALTLILSLLLFIQIIYASSSYATTFFYVDPDYNGGTRNGNAATPWRSLSDTITNAPWTVINTALTTDNVTVYFSARNASADTQEISAGGVEVTKKTPNPGFTLILDGHSQYNTNDAAPTWSTYVGGNRAVVKFVNSQNDSHIRYNNVTVDGFIIQLDSPGKAVAICGNNWTVMNSDISHTAAATDGPLVLLVPTADAAHEGSSAYCPASTNINITNNTIHDSSGELIYLGAGGCDLSFSAALQRALDPSACQGQPTHSNINITNNTLYNGGVFGHQGDGIDMKAALTNVTIRGNTFRNLSDPLGQEIRAIVLQGIQTGGTNQNITIERNFFHDIASADGIIAVVNSWGTPNGIMIRNNILYNGTRNFGIRVYDTQAVGVLLYNNTVYNMPLEAINMSSGTIVMKNNVFLANNGGGSQTSVAGTVTSDHNASGSTWGTICTTCISGLTTGAFADAARGDFTPTVGSALLDGGTTIGSFSDDMIGTTRPQGLAWDIGACEANPTGRACTANSNVGIAVPPAAPTGLTVQ